MAQLGSALLWGSRGRGFKSRRSDSDESSPVEKGAREGPFLLLASSLACDQVRGIARNAIPVAEITAVFEKRLPPNYADINEKESKIHLNY